MILEEIRLTDFRCFFGETFIRFSEEEDRNVTIIYAENGVGKTTLLNALLWCFYGETTARFEKSEDILNYDAKKAGRSRASVEVLFEHNDTRYIAKRFADIKSSSGREFLVARIEQGNQSRLNTPDTFINTVIPRDMASHFLFDGEYAEVFLGEKNRDSIKSAVRDILGCSLVETAIEDLKAVSETFRKQTPSKTLTKQDEELESKLDILQKQIEDAEEKIEGLEKRRKQTSEQMTHIESKLRNSSSAKELQKGRDNLNDQLKRIQKRQKEHGNEVYKWLGENGRFIVSKRITEETFSFLDEKQHRGRIPSPYNEEFVKDVLETEECICGAKLEPGSPESKRVAGLLEEATALERVLSECTSVDMVVTAQDTVEFPSRPKASLLTSSVDAADALRRWDDNGNGQITCSEARRHGIAPVPRSHPAYRHMHDGDGDGVVCE